MFSNPANMQPSKQGTNIDVLLPSSPETPFKFGQLSRRRPRQRKDPLQNHVLHSVGTSLQSFLDFHNLTFLKTTDQLFCRMSLNFTLSDVSSRLDSSHPSLAGRSQEDSVLFPSYPTRCHTIGICPTTDGVNVDPVVKEVTSFLLMLEQITTNRVA